MLRSTYLLGLILTSSLTWAQQVTCNAGNSLGFSISDAQNVAAQLCQAYTGRVLNPSNSISNEGIGGSFASVFYNEVGCGSGGTYAVPDQSTCEYFFTHILQSCGASQGGDDVGGVTYDNCGGYRVEHAT